MLKTAAIFILLFAAAWPAAAGRAPAGLVMVIDEYDDELRVDLALRHAAQLKRSGLDVRLVFEWQGVLNFLPPQRGLFARNGAGARRLAPARGAAALLKELEKLKVPVTVCALSAAGLGKYEELKAVRAPLSADPTRLVDLSGFVKAGYRILVF